MGRIWGAENEAVRDFSTRRVDRHFQQRAVLKRMEMGTGRSDGSTFFCFTHDHAVDLIIINRSLLMVKFTGICVWSPAAIKSGT
jgi:hypothetical protein